MIYVKSQPRYHRHGGKVTLDHTIIAMIALLVGPVAALFATMGHGAVGRLPKPKLLQGLGLVLVIAGAKLIFT